MRYEKLSFGSTRTRSACHKINRSRFVGTAAVLVIVLFALKTGLGQEIDGFRAEVFKDGKGKTMPYRLYIPRIQGDGARYPLVVFLHGFEARGSDNRKQLQGMDRAGSHVWASPVIQADNPCFVLAPQCPLGGLWANPLTRNPTGSLRRLVDLVGDIVKRYPVETDRIYVTGQSMGAFGAWALISNYPLFAAAVPVCGGGRAGKARTLATIPVWAFHGSMDPVVPVFESRRMISAIRKAGGNPMYTEYSHKLHNVWNLAYSDSKMVQWLFSQRRHADAH